MKERPKNGGSGGPSLEELEQRWGTKKRELGWDEEFSSAQLESIKQKKQGQLDARGKARGILLSNRLRREIAELVEQIEAARIRERLGAEREKSQKEMKSKNGKTPPAKVVPGARLANGIPKAPPITTTSPPPSRRRVIEPLPSDQSRFAKDLREARATLPPTPPAETSLRDDEEKIVDWAEVLEQNVAQKSPEKKVDPRRAIREKIAAAKPFPKIHIIPERNITASEVLAEQRRRGEKIAAEEERERAIQEARVRAEQEARERRAEEERAQREAQEREEARVGENEWTQEDQEELDELYRERARLEAIVAQEKTEALTSKEPIKEAISNSLVEDQIAGLLRSSDKISEVKSVKVEGRGDELSLNIKVSALGFNIGVHAILESREGEIVVKTHEVNAKWPAKGKVEGMIGPKLGETSKLLKDFIEKQKSRGVKSLEIKNGQLEVTFV